MLRAFRRRSARVLLLVVGLVSPAIGRAEDAPAPASPRDVSALLAGVLEKSGSPKVPGMVGAIVAGSDVVAIGAAGVRSRGEEPRVEVGDRFHIGSCTKAMTATLCAMLVEEGKLRWDQPVTDLLGGEEAKEAWRKATLERLLTNRGGAFASPGPLWLAVLGQHDRTKARALLVNGTLRVAPAHEPGTRYVYSNTNFVLAGAMAEAATGKPWEDLLRKRLFRPLGMASAGFGAPGKPLGPDEPLGHTAAGKPVWADNPPALGPAGTVHCSIGDWAKFVALHLQGARGNARLLKAETFRRLHTPPPDEQQRYAMGWLIAERPWAGGRVLNHAGSNTMWFAVTWIAPGKDFAVLVACNQGGPVATRVCDAACGALIRDQLKTTGER